MFEKRDRATIVEDSIQYLKNLHHRLKDLEQKRSEMKSSCTTDTAMKQINAPGPAPFHVTVAKEISSRPGLNKVVSVDNNIVSSPSESNDMIALANTSIEKVEVHVDLPQEIVIEMTCRSHGHIQSQILQTLERLRMDVLRCSISKLHGRIMCVVVVKVVYDPTLSHFWGYYLLYLYNFFKDYNSVSTLQVNQNLVTGSLGTKIQDGGAFALLIGICGTKY